MVFEDPFLRNGTQLSIPAMNKDFVMHQSVALHLEVASNKEFATHDDLFIWLSLIIMRQIR